MNKNYNFLNNYGMILLLDNYFGPLLQQCIYHTEIVTKNVYDSFIRNMTLFFLNEIIIQIANCLIFLNIRMWKMQNNTMCMPND